MGDSISIPTQTPNVPIVYDENRFRMPYKVKEKVNQLEGSQMGEGEKFEAEWSNQNKIKHDKKQIKQDKQQNTNSQGTSNYIDYRVLFGTNAAKNIVGKEPKKYENTHKSQLQSQPAQVQLPKHATNNGKILQVGNNQKLKKAFIRKIKQNNLNYFGYEKFALQNVNKAQNCQQIQQQCNNKTNQYGQEKNKEQDGHISSNIGKICQQKQINFQNSQGFQNKPKSQHQALIDNSHCHTLANLLNQLRSNSMSSCSREAIPITPKRPFLSCLCSQNIPPQRSQSTINLTSLPSQRSNSSYISIVPAADEQMGRQTVLELPRGVVNKMRGKSCKYFGRGA